MQVRDFVSGNLFKKLHVPWEFVWAWSIPSMGFVPRAGGFTIRPFRTAEVTGSVVAFAKLQGLVGGNAAIPGGNVAWTGRRWLWWFDGCGGNMEVEVAGLT